MSDESSARIVITLALPFIFYTPITGERFMGLPKRCSCGITEEINERVVGGVEAKKHEFPWQVGITTKTGQPFCGGALISDRWVLTAAHCIDDRAAWQTFVLLGGHDWADPDSERFNKRVSDIIAHSEYDDETLINDIALLRLNEKVMFNASMRPACFPRPGQNYANKMAVVSGWGRTTEGGRSADILQKVEVPIWTIKKCRAALGYTAIHSTVICAGWDAGKKDACDGDSGGPLIIREDQRSYLIGLVSWGIGCARKDTPGIYTRVDYYYDWINMHTEGSKFCTH